MVNVNNINKVIDALRKDQELGTHFVMADFGTYLAKEKVPSGEYGSHQLCNTAFCLAGWANFIKMKDENPDSLKSKNFIDMVADEGTAAEWLGIDGCDYDPDDLFRMMSAAYHSLESFDALPAEKRYAAGIRVMEILRDTGKINWSKALTESGCDDK